MNWERPDVQAGFRKDRGTRDQIANICWIIEKANIWWIIQKAREFKKKSTFASLTMLKTLNVWITTNCGKFFKRWGYLTTLPASWETSSQETTVRTGHGTTDWFKIGKGVHQGCILSPCLFNIHAKYIIWNAGLDDSQAGIKIPERNTNNFRYADDTSLMAESEEELKSLLLRVKEESEKLV